MIECRRKKGVLHKKTNNQASELPELLGISDRIIVMREGVITGELKASEAGEESVMKLATKGA